MFETKTKDEAFQLIEDAKSFLKSLDGARLQGGNSDNVYDDLFDDVIEKQDDIDFSSSEDNKLRALEEGIDKD